MNFDGIIFDFNGTLYFDGEINDLAWSIIIKDLANDPSLDVKAFTKGFNTTQNHFYAQDILNKLKLPSGQEDIKKVWTAKEELYVKICQERKMFSLAPGVVNFLDELSANNIPINIASLAPDINFNFYFEYLKLAKWFKPNSICHDGPNIIGKKTLYQNAARNIKVNLANCLVFEDGIQGSKDAIEVGCQQIIMLNKPSNIDFKHPKIVKRIDDFREVSLTKLKDKYFI